MSIAWIYQGFPTGMLIKVLSVGIATYKRDTLNSSHNMQLRMSCSIPTQQPTCLIFDIVLSAPR